MIFLIFASKRGHGSVKSCPLPISLSPLLVVPTYASIYHIAKTIANAQLAILETFLQGHPSIKCTIPSSPEFSIVRKVWNLARPDTPLAFVHPQNAEDVRVLVQFVKSKGINFTVRTGGHNLEGRALVEGALVIDLRALTGVKVAEDLL
ncbi:hypothetical protein EYZ11_007747 [Aspergillus tanneri]|uniref:FAD-binding PCMH-type domain-containing protein n=1 Tax=Aspergillus tanneri TaxID=1220188 RepID=A0A4S3JC90_9EURO|nr:hypothetical protein EYZ11_007747 [Aspergillus tanneri]